MECGFCTFAQRVSLAAALPAASQPVLVRRTSDSFNHGPSCLIQTHKTPFGGPNLLLFVPQPHRSGADVVRRDASKGRPFRGAWQDTDVWWPVMRTGWVADCIFARLSSYRFIPVLIFNQFNQSNCNSENNRHTARAHHSSRSVNISSVCVPGLSHVCLCGQTARNPQL